MKLEFRKRWSVLIDIIGILLAGAAWKLGTAAGMQPKLLYVACAIFTLCGWIRIRVRFRILQFLPDVAWAAAGMPLTVYLTQWLMKSNVRTLDRAKVRLILGALIISVVILAVFVVVGSIRWSVLIGQTAIMLLTTANSFVYTFRGNELIPADFTSFGTAMNVAGSYEFNITDAMIRSWILLLAYFWAAWILPTWERPTMDVVDQYGKIRGEKKRYTGLDVFLGVGLRVLAAVLAFNVAVGVMNFGTNRKNVIIKHFERQGTDVNGFLVNFYLRLPEMLPEKPGSYGRDSVAALEEKVREAKEGEEVSERQPTIIAIMDESFADLSVRNPEGEMNTNQEVIPYILSLRENAVSGYAIASVYGGNTPNSEYEFLTGHSMAWVPFGAIAYQNDVKDRDYSLVSVLKERGYACTAMHPYKANGWKRPAVYDYFGFDTMLFEEDFAHDDLVRDYVSDQEMFEKIIDIYESDKDTPQFIWGVTMQNHGGYEYKGDNFDVDVKAEGYKKSYTKANQYLTLIHKTDEAVENLLDYFSAVEDDVVIVFFGDHQPHIEESFYKELHGGSLETLDEKELRYVVPFFVWANYDIDEQYYDLEHCISLNYLSGIAMQAAGMEMTPYQQFLEGLRETIPAVNQLGYYSKEAGGFKELDEAEGEEAAALEEYAVLQYNDLHDRKNTSEYFFPRLEKND